MAKFCSIFLVEYKVTAKSGRDSSEFLLENRISNHSEYDQVAAAAVGILL